MFRECPSKPSVSRQRPFRCLPRPAALAAGSVGGRSNLTLAALSMIGVLDTTEVESRPLEGPIGHSCPQEPLLVTLHLAVRLGSRRGPLVAALGSRDAGRGSSVRPCHPRPGSRAVRAGGPRRTNPPQRADEKRIATGWDQRAPLPDLGAAALLTVRRSLERVGLSLLLHELLLASEHADEASGQGLHKFVPTACVKTDAAGDFDLQRVQP
jgi:hypothetical protein